MPTGRRVPPGLLVFGALWLTLLAPDPAAAQEPAAWRTGLDFHTFSIAAVDPRTGELGVAVTTRNVCVGNGVPWVRKEVGAVATQASTRTEYGLELLDALERGESPEAALRRLVAADSGAAQRQIGVIARDGRSAQHTGSGTNAWAGHRSGRSYVTQGNILVGPEVLVAVAAHFESTEGTLRHLADRLIDAIAAGHVLGGDKRHGLRASAAVVVVDPRPGMSRRTDGQTVNLNVCEHPDPVGELRRVYDAVSQTLGYRHFEQVSGGDVAQLKLMLHTLGFFRPGGTFTLREPDAGLYTPEAVAAVDAFRSSERMGTPAVGGSPAGLVDRELVTRLWAALERTGAADRVRQQLLDLTMIRR